MKFTEKVFHFIYVLPTKVARDGPGLTRERRDDDYSVKHSEMKKSNSKSTIKAIEKKRDFHTSHAECPLLIGAGTGGEEETLYIRSSMEEDRAYW